MFFQFELNFLFLLFFVLLPIGSCHNILMLLFFVLVVMNFTSLSSYIFSFTSHVSMTLSLSLLLFLGVLVLQNIYFKINFIISLTPLNTPFFLISFMVLIEMISKIIRPLTLGMRLGANMTAGHLIMSMMKLYQLPLMCLEFMVAVVQGIVFVLLMKLYLEE